MRCWRTRASLARDERDGPARTLGVGARRGQRRDRADPDRGRAAGPALGPQPARGDRRQRPQGALRPARGRGGIPHRQRHHHLPRRRHERRRHHAAAVRRATAGGGLRAPRRSRRAVGRARASRRGGRGPRAGRLHLLPRPRQGVALPARAGDRLRHRPRGRVEPPGSGRLRAALPGSRRQRAARRAARGRSAARRADAAARAARPRARAARARGRAAQGRGVRRDLARPALLATASSTARASCSPTNLPHRRRRPRSCPRRRASRAGLPGRRRPTATPGNSVRTEFIGSGHAAAEATGSGSSARVPAPLPPQPSGGWRRGGAAAETMAHGKASAESHG